MHFDLFKSELFNRYLTQPHFFREDCLQNAATRTYPVIVDEVQKIPQLLNEVHWLIENENMQFILCGSSARQLKQHGVNMLGGRAWRYRSKIPKFYLFDVGIANFLAKTVITDLHGAAAGKAFEHFIFMELYAFHSKLSIKAIYSCFI